MLSLHTNKRTISVVGVSVILVVAFALIGKVAFATEPTAQERAAAELPTVLKEIERTQEYADRNVKAHERREKILSCVNTGSCEGF